MKRFALVFLSFLIWPVFGFVLHASTFHMALTHAAVPRTKPLVHVAFPINAEPAYTPNVGDRMKLLCKKYIALNEKKPLITKGVSAAIVQALGDILSQQLMSILTRSRFQWDMMRTLTFMVIGLCYKGPMLHVWYKALNRIAHWTKIRKGFSETKQSLVALTVDQTIGVIIFYPLYYVAYEVCSSLVAFRAYPSFYTLWLAVPNLVALQAKMAATIIPIILAQYYVWPLAQFFSFKYCPAPLRVLYTNFIAVFWNCFLCAHLAASG